MTFLVGLQGCVVPAAMRTLERWTEYEFVTAQPIDADHFRVVIEVAHKRGAFNPLGSHGSGQVISRIDVELWRLAVTEKGIEPRKEDALSFDSPEEIARWRDRKTVDLDMAGGRIRMPQPSDPSPSGAIYSRNLRWVPAQQMVRGSVRGQECAVRLPPASTASNGWRGFVASDEGDAFMIVDDIGRSRQAAVLSACDAGKPAHPVRPVVGWPLGFTTYPDGSPRVIRGQAHETYEVQIYPGPERLTFKEQDMGLESNRRWSSKAFMFEERTRRFHWVVAPVGDTTSFVFVTHDPANGQTTRRAFALKAR